MKILIWISTIRQCGICVEYRRQHERLNDERRSQPQTPNILSQVVEFLSANTTLSTKHTNIMNVGLTSYCNKNTKIWPTNDKTIMYCIYVVPLFVY
jgi:hypothetical protein